MKCEKITQLMPDFLMDYLEPDKKKQIEAHLEECPKCKQELEQFETLWAKFGQLPVEEPSSSVSTRFYSMLEAYNQGLEHNRVKVSLGDRLSTWLESWWPRRPAYQFSIALVFLVSGLLAGRFMDSIEQRNSQITEMKQEIQDMRQMVTLSILNQSSSLERLQGLSMSSNVENPDEEFLSVLLLTLNTDPDVNVRMAAVDALKRFNDNQWVRSELIRSLAYQTSPLVQVSLIDLMVEMSEQNSVEVLRAMTEDQSTIDAVKDRARWGIQQII